MKKLLAVVAVLVFSAVVFAQTTTAPATAPKADEITKKCEQLVKEGKFKTVEECVKAETAKTVPATK